MRKLTSADLTEIEERLRGMRIALVEAVRERRARGGGQMHSAGSVQRAPPGALSAAFGDVNAAFGDALTQDEIAMLQHELEELRAIDDALKRIEFGVGGLCTHCGVQIPLGRLRAVPAAATCIACAALVQRESRSG